MGEDIGDTGSYLEREGNLSSDMGEEICGVGGGRIGGEFFNDCVTLLIKLLITAKTSLRARLFRRFRLRVACARDFRRRGTCGSTKI